jgi:hypothetical protein
MKLRPYFFLCLRAGWAPKELDLKESFALGAVASIFQTEVHTILNRQTIWICSDSRTALLSLTAHTVTSKLVLECQSSLQGFSTHNRVQLYWVSGHCCIIGDKEADALAGLGSESNFYGPDTFLLVPKALIKCIIEEW